MKKYLPILVFLLINALTLHAQKQNTPLIIPDSSEMVVIVTTNSVKIEGKIIAERGDTLLVNAVKSGVSFMLKQNIKSITLKRL
jgi:uncharacterized Zn-binding protein involved in type VI secretion